MRIATLENDNSEISVWVVKADGGKLTDPQEKENLVNSMRDQIEQPLRIKVVTRGLDTELLVATPIESCGRGRPRVVYDVSLALRTLDICIFQVINPHPYFCTEGLCSFLFWVLHCLCRFCFCNTYALFWDWWKELLQVIIILIGIAFLLAASATGHYPGSVLIWDLVKNSPKKLCLLGSILLWWELKF